MEIYSTNQKEKLPKLRAVDALIKGGGKIVNSDTFYPDMVVVRVVNGRDRVSYIESEARLRLLVFSDMPGDKYLTYPGARAIAKREKELPYLALALREAPPNRSIEDLYIRNLAGQIKRSYVRRWQDFKDKNGRSATIDKLMGLLELIDKGIPYTGQEINARVNAQAIKDLLSPAEL